MLRRRSCFHFSILLLWSFLCGDHSSLALPNCFEQIDSFCKTLYDPKNPLEPGNLNLKLGGNNFELRFGRNEKNFSYAFIKFALAKIDAEKSLPASFKEYLEKQNYFTKLKSYLKTPRPITPLAKRAIVREGDTLNSIWNIAYLDSVNREMEKTHPGFLKVKHWPPPWKRHQKQFRQKLEIAVNIALWQNHPDWKKAETQFLEVKNSLLEEIRTLPNLSDKTRREWLEQIETVKLLVPGSTDFLLEIDENCAKSEVNAFYSAEQHALTLCAGDFIAGPALFTLAHELSHAIGENRNVFLATAESNFEKDLRVLGQDLCNGPALGCSPAWKKLKADLKSSKALTETIDHYSVEAEKLKICLQNQPIPDNPERLKKAALEAAHSSARYYTTALSREHFFLSSIKSKTLDAEGNEFANEGYFNPCNGEEFSKLRLHAGSALKVFFLAEYQCNLKTDPIVRLKESIQLAEDLQRGIYEKTILMGGRLSSNRTLNSKGAALDTGEQFADWMASRVLARLIQKRSETSAEKITEIGSNLALLCDPPGIENLYRQEAEVEKQFDPEPHPLNSSRLRQIVSPPLEKALGCEVTPHEKECVL